MSSRKDLQALKAVDRRATLNDAIVFRAIVDQHASHLADIFGHIKISRAAMIASFRRLMETSEDGVSMGLVRIMDENKQTFSLTEEGERIAVSLRQTMAKDERGL